MDATIRDEAVHDADAVRRVLLAAFPTSAESDLVERLRANGRLAISLVAEIGGAVVGHLAFSPVTVEATSEKADGLGLAPVAVLPEHQRRGIGAALVTAGLERCRERGIAFVVVLGEPDYYSRFGFAPASGFGLANEYGVDAEFMALELVDRALAVCSGLVRYAPEFAALE